MKMVRWLGVAALALLGLQASPARAWHCGGWSVGINLGGPVFAWPWGCYYGPSYYYYRPYPVYVAPAPVVVQPAPAVVPAAPVVSSAPPAPAAVLSPPVARASGAEPLTVATASYSSPAGVERNLQLLAGPNEQVRINAVMELGKGKVVRAVDPLAATLAGDRSPAVRDAAARALGLIGSPRCLPALKFAAQADADRDVRHSAQFAVEIVQSNMKR